jgi:hypothetical protein
MLCTAAEQVRPVKVQQISQWKRYAMRSNNISPSRPGCCHEFWAMTLQRLELLNPRSCIIASYGVMRQ